MEIRGGCQSPAVTPQPGNYPAEGSSLPSKIEDHDYQTKVSQAQKFRKSGDKVKQ